MAIQGSSCPWSPHITETIFLNTDLTSAQADYATFLPALSSFYVAFIGKQRFSEYVDNARIPAHLQMPDKSLEKLNLLNAKDGIFNYKWALYSPGHAELDTNKLVEKEDMIRNRDRDNTWLLADSGGFQIAKGVWEADWKDPNCPRSSSKRAEVLTWMNTYMDYAMTLDIPAWVVDFPKGRDASGIFTYAQAIQATKINNDYWMNNQNGNCKFLNVMQGETQADSDVWYNHMKDYCDPKVYPSDHFNGWAFGGQNKCDMHMALRRIVRIIRDGLLEPGLHDVMHMLGTSKLEWALMFTDIQRAIRKYHNPNLRITFDCASPFLATANGQIYTETRTQDRQKWSYRMLPGPDDRKYHNDPRSYRDAALQDGYFPVFEDSPVTQPMGISDICCYAPGQTNKIGKVGKTSWDSFSYELQMAHNVWTHINAVQESNRQYDAGITPAMLVQEKHDQLYFRHVVEEVFANISSDRSLEIIDDYNRYWLSLIGNGRMNGKRTINSITKFKELFEVVETPEPAHCDTDDFGETEIAALETLETQV